MTRGYWPLRLVAFAAVVVSCGSPAGPPAGARPGIIVFHGDPIVIEVPDTVQAGVPFDVSVRTYGGGCVSQGGTTIDVDSLAADVRSYDVYSGHNACDAILQLFEHRATVSLAQPGLAELRFHGREMPADSSVVLVHSVVVE